MTKYETLVNILDKIRAEAPTTFSKKYGETENDIEKLNQSRARAFIHLYLKVSFGLLDFKEREHFVTDGSYDGGVDGYYINKENRTIYFIQSKFRANGKNFEGKEIALEEILIMDINRILEGEEKDEKGNFYSGKIKQLQREISNVDNIARYSYKVIILANLTGITAGMMKKLTGGFHAEVLNYEKCYYTLVFPVLSGTYFNASDLSINIDLSNKNAGSKISYTVQTKKGECEITVLFVPTLEFAKLMFKYKNSILKFNPRSYLEFEGQKVNNAIRETILKNKTNEFALFNNGITMLSDETFINEKIGQKNKAQLTVKNPQIINGGQTSFTLSRIYQDHQHDNVEEIFQNKEVLLKVITLLDRSDLGTKIDLIEEISTATNQQTPVITADRFSNDKIHLKLQDLIFDRYGLLYERKRGEFGDGVYNNYVENAQIVERNLFFRMYYASNGFINKSRQKKLFLRQDFSETTLQDIDKIDNAYFGYLCFKRLHVENKSVQKIQLSIYAKIFAMTLLYKPTSISDYENSINQNISKIEKYWPGLIEGIPNKEMYQEERVDFKTGIKIVKSGFKVSVWYDSPNFKNDLLRYFNR